MIAQRPAELPVRLLFQDEARFGRLSDHRRCWAPWPSRPTVGQQVIREYTYALAAVSPWDGRLSTLVLPWVDTETMSLFLAAISHQFFERVIVRLEGGSSGTFSLAGCRPTCAGDQGLLERGCAD